MKTSDDLYVELLRDAQTFLRWRIATVAQRNRVIAGELTSVLASIAMCLASQTNRTKERVCSVLADADNATARFDRWRFDGEKVKQSEGV